jgi:hypothetical protein
MKKLIIIATFILLVLTVNAQQHTASRGSGIDVKVLNTCAAIYAVSLGVAFILIIMKRLLEYRLKNRIVEKGIPENLAASILQAGASEEKNANIKWFSLLTGAGIGLTIIYYTQPLGIHSLAIMSFSIAMSFLGYHFFIKRTCK